MLLLLGLTPDLQKVGKPPGFDASATHRETLLPAKPSSPAPFRCEMGIQPASELIDETSADQSPRSTHTNASKPNQYARSEQPESCSGNEYTGEVS